MKYLKITFITILLFIIMFIPVNASILTLPELPGDYEDYIIFDSSNLGGNNPGLKAITFNNLGYMYVGTLAEYMDEVGISETNREHHLHDALYFRQKKGKHLEYTAYKLVGDDWEYVKSDSELDYLQYGYTWNSSIKNSNILYSSMDIIDLTNGSVFFFNGSWMMAGLIQPVLGLLPYLIGLLIILAAFSKALQFLFKTLRKA